MKTLTENIIRSFLISSFLAMALFGFLNINSINDFGDIIGVLVFLFVPIFSISMLLLSGDFLERKFRFLKNKTVRFCVYIFTILSSAFAVIMLRVFLFLPNRSILREDRIDDVIEASYYLGSATLIVFSIISIAKSRSFLIPISDKAPGSFFETIVHFLFLVMIVFMFSYLIIYDVLVPDYERPG